MEGWKHITLTALSGMGVVMDREAAWAVKPFPATMADVLPCPMVVVVLRVHGTGRIRRRRSAPGTRPPLMTHGRGGCRGWTLLRASVKVHSVEDELWGDGTRGHFLTVAARFDKVYAECVNPRTCSSVGLALHLLGKSSRRLGSGVGDMKKGTLISCHHCIRSYNKTAKPREGGPHWWQDVYRRSETRHDSIHSSTPRAGRCHPGHVRDHRWTLIGRGGRRPMGAAPRIPSGAELICLKTSSHSNHSGTRYVNALTDKEHWYTSKKLAAKHNPSALTARHHGPWPTRLVAFGV